MYSFQANHSPGQTIQQAIKQALRNLKGLQSLNVYCPTIKKLKITKKSAKSLIFGNEVTLILNDPWVKKQITREVGKYFEENENKKTIYQNL